MNLLKMAKVFNGVPNWQIPPNLVTLDVAVVQRKILK